MNRFQPSRIAIASVVFTFLTCATIASTLTISDNSHHQAFRIPFREANHRILVSVEVDGTLRTLLFDTGARVSVLLRRKGRDCELRLAHHPQGKFALACNDGAPCVGFVIPEKEVHFDGFVGADLMSKFASVRIDYSQHLIELEK